MHTRVGRKWKNIHEGIKRQKLLILNLDFNERTYYLFKFMWNNMYLYTTSSDFLHENQPHSTFLCK